MPLNLRTTELKEVKFRIKRDKVVLATTVIGLSSFVLVAPTTAGAAPADNNPPQIPAEATPTWKNTIEQQHIWQDALQKQRIKSLRQPQALDETPEEVIAETDSASTDCLPIRRIELGAMPELSKEVQNELSQQATQLSLAPGFDETKQTKSANTYCVSIAGANQLVRAITSAYLEAGYFKISIETASDEPRVSTWQVYVAKITDINNQTDLPTSRLFGNIIGKPANMATLDQAISNGERVIDGQLMLDIYPVGNDVRLEVTGRGEVDPLKGDIEYRYDPDDSYGHNQIKLHGTLYNVFGQADLTSISMQQSLTDKYGYDEDNQRRNASIYTSIPNGRWQWSGLLAADEYTRTTKLPNSILKQSGDSWQANIRGDYTFNRDQDSISTIYGQIAHQDLNSELMGSQLDVQSPTLSSARIGASHTKLFNSRSKKDPRKVTTGALVVDLSVEQGIGNHDNPATAQGLSDDYLRWLLSGYLTHQHSIIASDKYIGSWQMTHELQGQYTDDQLYGVTQQSLGSTYSGVRGLDNAYNAAESGISLRNTLSYEPMQTSWWTVGAEKIRWAPYIGASIGMVKNSETELSDDSSEAVSGTLGLRLTGYDVKSNAMDRRWLLDISASRADVDYADKRYDGTQDTEVSAAWQWFF